MTRWKHELLLGGLTVLIGVVALVADQTARIPIVTSITLAIGLLLIAVSVLIKIQFAHLIGQLRASTAYGQEFLAATRSIQEANDFLFKTLASSALHHSRNIIRQISTLAVSYPYPRQRQHVIESVAKAKNSIVATHYCGTLAYIDMWKTDVIQGKYFEENKTAVEKGVSVDRTFILAMDFVRNDPAVDILHEILDQHSAAGIRVMVLFEPSLGGDSWGEDYVIVDRTRLHIYLREESTLFKSVTLTIDPTRIESARRVLKSVALTSLRWPKERLAVLEEIHRLRNE
jgi:hypothetical protein